MDKTYHDVCVKMEKMGVDPEYVLGWQGGYLGHPGREEQRVTEAYSSGYQDGQEKATDKFQDWTKK